MKNLPVSIIIAAYNEEKYIETCLASLATQDYTPLEILVVDDGSTDRTKEIIKKFNVTLLSLDHEGTAVSRNYAVQKAKGDIVSFLDADMVFESDFITKLVEPINKGDTKGTFSKLEYVKNWDKPLARCWNRNNIPKLPEKMRVPQDSNEGDDFRAILKSEFERVGGFDNTGYSDTWTLFQKLGYKATPAPNAIYHHYNPESYEEVFTSAQWVGKRKYKLGVVGSLIALVRANPVLALVKGVVRAVQYMEWEFVPFQIVYDLGISKGVLQSILSGRLIK
jgi:glycosyltransferase involved in cell wall biosynthesis